MDALIRRQIESLHASPAMAVMAITGGGSRALAWLLGVPGASRTVLEAVVPYSPAALEDHLGYAPDTVVSAETASGMARSAYRRALGLRPGGVPVTGIGCTATIATDRVKRGDHRCFVAACTSRAVTTYAVTFVKGLRDRGGEEEIVSRLVLSTLAAAGGVESDVPRLLDPREKLEIATNEREDLLQDLLAGRVSSVTVHADGSTDADEPHRGGVLSGSFDPLHDGHEALADVASRMLKAEVVFELSILNVDKPPLERGDLDARLARLAGKRSTLVTRTPTFHLKARLLPGCTFVIGWDTAVRLFDRRYYGADEGRMQEALGDIRRLGCRFLVAGRTDRGVFRTLGDLAIPEGFEDMLAAIPESEFRVDISSTGLRRSAGST